MGHDSRMKNESIEISMDLEGWLWVLSELPEKDEGRKEILDQLAHDYKETGLGLTGFPAELEEVMYRSEKVF